MGHHLVVEAHRIPSLPVYLRSLRVLGAWWCRGSSSVDPLQLLLHQSWQKEFVPLHPRAYASDPRAFELAGLGEAR